jgi:hypothetical protein
MSSYCEGRFDLKEEEKYCDLMFDSFDQEPRQKCWTALYIGIERFA